MEGIRKRSGIWDLAHLIAVMLIAFALNACAGPRDSTAADAAASTLASSPGIYTQTTTAPEYPQPTQTLPSQYEPVAYNAFNGLQSAAWNCGPSIQNSEPLISYLSGLLNSPMTGQGYGAGVGVSLGYGGSFLQGLGLSPGSSATSCFSGLGSAMNNIALLGQYGAGYYEANELGGYVSNVINWAQTNNSVYGSGDYPL